MKKIFLFAAIAALFAACSSKDELVKDDTTQQPQLEKGAIGFDAYTQKATTRGGWAGSLTTAKLQNNDDAKFENGFGVFGYYTDNNEYEQRSVPNFMYNQQVTYDAGSWVYYPIMYWPNEYGSNATSDDQDKVTFFAYAPYVKVIPTSGKLARTTTDPDPDDTKTLESYGITSMTRNSAQGDPILKYIASFNHNRSVDLCWGVADNNDGKNWGLTQTGTAQNPGIENGTPWLNLERPANTDQRVKFTFKHALAQMQVNIDADVDVDGRGHDNAVATKTRVWVRSVTFKGFALKGALNLNNETVNKPKWLDYGGQNEIVSEDVIVYDGRKDGKEGVAGAVATNEKSLGLNPAIVQDGLYSDSEGKTVNVADNKVFTKGEALTIYGPKPDGSAYTDNTEKAQYNRPGVTNIPVPLFCQNLENKNDATGDVFHVIPTDDNLDIEIVYDIETVDQSLAQNLSDGATKGSSIENRISKEISFGTLRKLEAGHSYKLNLHLGMNSVKFDAAVVDWIEEPKQDVDLPLNVPAFPINSTPTVTWPYKGDYSFAITGLDGGESMNVVPGTNQEMGASGGSASGSGFLEGWNPNKSGGEGFDVWAATKNNANSSGVAIQTVTIYPNNNTIDRTQQITWTGAQSGEKVDMTLVQAAHPLFLKISKTENSGSKGVITLTRCDDETRTTSNHWKTAYGWICDGDGAELTPSSPASANHIKVYRNGAELTWDTSASGNTFTFTNKGENEATAKITIGDELKVGDVIEVVLKTGDAPEETVTTQVYGFSFTQPIYGIKVGETKKLAYTKNGDGAVSFASGNSAVTIVNPAESEVTGVNSGGAATITATITNTAKCSYLENTVTCIVGVGDEVIGNPLSRLVIKTSAPAETVYVSGLTASETVTNSTDETWITINSATTDANGVCTITFTAADNDASTENRTGHITITGSGKSTTITVTQAGT